MCWGPHHLWGIRGYGRRWEQAGASWSTLGSELEQTGEQAGVSWSKLGSELERTGERAGANWGASWSDLGSKLEQTGVSWSELEQAGVNWGVSWSKLEQTGASWSEPSERNVILGFRAPTTVGGKTPIMTYSAYVSPPPGSKIPTQCAFT